MAGKKICQLGVLQFTPNDALDRKVSESVVGSKRGLERLFDVSDWGDHDDMRGAPIRSCRVIIRRPGRYMHVKRVVVWPGYSLGNVT